MTRQTTHRALAALSLGLLVSASGCYAGYAGAVSEMHAAIDQGDADAALLFANQALGVDNAQMLPSESHGDTPLLLLERASLLQSMGRHGDAARDFAEADKSMEVLDLSQDDAAQIGEYLFSDDIEIYKAPPHEKLLVNTLAMLSYLADGDLDGARVEARRLTVLQKYFEGVAPEERALFGLGSYVAGFTFEKSGEADQALRYYIEARDKGGHDRFAAPIVYLGKQTGFTHDLVAQAALEAPDASAPEAGEGEILVVVQNGRGAFKEPERFPIGAFVVSDIHVHMSVEARADADRVMASGLLKWINFPVLRSVPPRLDSFRVRVDGETAEPQVGLDVDASIISAWESNKDKLMVAAFTRMVTRAVAGEATRAVGEGSGLDKNLFPGASALLGAVVEGAMAANDTPDTRSWTMLPSDIRIYRLKVPAGEHKITVTGSGTGSARRSMTVDVRPGGFALANFRFLN